MKGTLKNKSLLLLIVLAIAGLLLILLSPIIEDRQDKKDTIPEQQEALAAFLEQTKGVGEVHLRLCANENGEIIGAAVICEGGEDPLVASKVIRLLSAALGLPSNKIEVCGTKG